jgi:hypothetical protein
LEPKTIQSAAAEPVPLLDEDLGTPVLVKPNLLSAKDIADVGMMWKKVGLAVTSLQHLAI